MSSAGKHRDLIVLAADKSMNSAVTQILDRPKSLGIRKITFHVRTHPQRDPGVLHRSHELLRPLAGKYAHAIVLFDREGCGKEKSGRVQLEREVESRLASNGWSTRAAAIALDPELEIWVWSDSPEVDRALGWQHETPDLRTWLNESGFLSANQRKPRRPKEAMEAALRLVKQPQSSAIYAKLAQQVSFNRCVDPAFDKFRTTLKDWFSP